MRKYFVLCLIVFLAGMALAQNKYERAAKDFSYGGIKIGMSKAQVKAKCPKVEFLVEPAGGGWPELRNGNFELDDATKIHLDFDINWKVYEIVVTLTEMGLFEKGGVAGFALSLGKKLGDPTKVVERYSAQWTFRSVSRQIVFVMESRALYINSKESLFDPD